MSKSKDARKIHISRLHKPGEMTVEEWQRALRREFGIVQKYQMKNIGGAEVFSEYNVTNPETKQTYRVAIRGEQPGENFCSCPDFSVNTLGTCKHVEFVLSRLRKNRQRRKLLAVGHALPYSEIFLRYGSSRQVVFRPGVATPLELKRFAVKYFDTGNVLRPESFQRFGVFLEKARALEPALRCYDDALAFIGELQEAEHRKKRLAGIFPGGIKSRAFETLLKAPLYPYQREGALFAVKAGRALIADEMGLGKTIQAIAASEILAREFGIQKVLIICPTSLKSQWKDEIAKFCNRSAAVVEGLSSVRRKIYQSSNFFVIAAYDVIYRDVDIIKEMAPDLVILDEAQRIKNWKTRAARHVKQIASPYAIVLTGTPLENRLEELHSIVEFVDRFRLGPLFRFVRDHQETDGETGKVVGYKDLKSIGETLADILLRRKKTDVLLQLPERLDKNFFVPMLPQQMDIHEENREIVSKIAAKWRKQKFLTDADQKRLTIALQRMRMACNNAYLVDKETKAGTKIEELVELLGEVFEDKSVKVVVFSQWEIMTSLIAEAFDRKKWGYVRLHGGVPGHDRGKLIRSFREEPERRVFLSTDAGGVGLNLQVASIVVNMDLPWNPAVLEQRIGRVHRLGQHRPVRVVNFVAERTIEHHMLSVLKFKKALFTGALDGGEDSIFIGQSRLSKFMESVEAITNSTYTGGGNGDGVVETDGKNIFKVSVQEVKKSDLATPPLQNLRIVGASFLRALAEELEKNPVGVEQDTTTGKSFLKVPLPDRGIMQAALPAIQSFLDILKGAIK